MGTLTADQSIFADQMSRVVARESSDFTNSSSDEELDQKKERKSFIISAKRLIRSSDKTDRRFINIFKVEKAYQNEKYQKMLVEKKLNSPSKDLEVPEESFRKNMIDLNLKEEPHDNESNYETARP